MDQPKPLEFHGGALGYFILSVLSIILIYIPFIGWAILLNYTASWFAENALVNGQKVTYKAGFGESLKFVFVNSLLMLITLGIYMFWFYPKMYRYVVDHTHYAGDGTVAETATAPAVTPEAPAEESSEPPAKLVQ